MPLAGHLTYWREGGIPITSENTELKPFLRFDLKLLPVFLPSKAIVASPSRCCTAPPQHSLATPSQNSAAIAHSTPDYLHTLVSQTSTLSYGLTSYPIRETVYLFCRVLVPARPVFFALTRDTLPCFADYSLAGIVDDLTALASLTLFPVPECSSSYSLARRTKMHGPPEPMPGCTQTSKKMMTEADVA